MPIGCSAEKWTQARGITDAKDQAPYPFALVRRPLARQYRHTWTDRLRDQVGNSLERNASADARNCQFWFSLNRLSDTNLGRWTGRGTALPRGSAKSVLLATAQKTRIGRFTIVAANALFQCQEVNFPAAKGVVVVPV